MPGADEGHVGREQALGAVERRSGAERVQRWGRRGVCHPNAKRGTVFPNLFNMPPKKNLCIGRERSSIQKIESKFPIFPEKGCICSALGDGV